MEFACIWDSLRLLKYDGALMKDKALPSTITVPYCEAVAWLVQKIKASHNLQLTVNSIDSASPDKVQTFKSQILAFLKSYGCPYKSIFEPSGLDKKQNLFSILDFLSTEALCCHMMLEQTQPPKEELQRESARKTEALDQLKKMAMALGFPKPPENITEQMLFNKLLAKVKENIGKVPADHVGRPLLEAKLTPKQWGRLDNINQQLHQEHSLRRNMLLQRLDLTVQAFNWSSQAKSHVDEMTEAYRPPRDLLTADSSISVTDLLYARDDLTNIKKTSSTDFMKSSVHKVIMGKVPDRGGRAHEMNAPPPEMPSFAARQAAPPSAGNRGGGRGFRGGRDGGYSGGRDGGKGKQYNGREGSGGGGGGRGNKGRGRVQGGWS